MGKKNTPPRNENPHLGDMFVAGLDLRDAVALEREMAAYPETDPDEWWSKIVALQCSQPLGSA